MGRALGVPVSLKTKSAGTGEIRIRYETAEELDGLCRLLQVAPQT
jgi:ParB family chromosome partitioning protein